MGKLLTSPGIIKHLKRIFTGKYIEETDIASQNIPAGKFVVWKNKLAQASSAITLGDALSVSNLTVLDDGGLNALNSNIATKDIAITVATGFNDIDGRTRCVKICNMLVLTIAVSTALTGGNKKVASIPSAYKPSKAVVSAIYDTTSKEATSAYIDTNGDVYITTGSVTASYAGELIWWI